MLAEEPVDAAATEEFDEQAALETVLSTLDEAYAVSGKVCEEAHIRWAGDGVYSVTTIQRGEGSEETFTIAL